MSATQAQLDALDKMIASGVLETEYDGVRLKYRSFSDLRAARRIVADQLAAAQGQARSTHTNPVFDRGL